MILLIFIGKIVSFISRLLNRGSGSTWPGHIAVQANKNFVRNLLDNNPKLKVILIVGTNGKTTTSLMVTEILKKANKRILRNTSGANLLNGVASSLLLAANWRGKVPYDYAVFEVDENSLPLVTKQCIPKAVIALNLFRDQLDRYGELDSIVKKWKIVFAKLPPTSTLVLNADDPLIAWLGEAPVAKVTYFGLPEKEMKATNLTLSADSIYCPRCGTKLRYKKISYSHLGDWSCPSCHLSRPKLNLLWKNYPLPGTYNMYNSLGAVAFAKSIGLYDDVIQKGFSDISPAFGRQEIIEINGKKVQIFLSKNPTSLNQSLETVINFKHGKDSGQARITLLLVLNDNIPDGRDVSWIWDIDLEDYINKLDRIIVSGQRCYDMGLRVQYALPSRHSREGGNPVESNTRLIIKEDLQEAIEEGLKTINVGETLYILPTYTAMLEVRKILTGRRIL